MKIRLGLVGPTDAINLISEVIDEHEDTFECISMVHTIYRESISEMIAAVDDSLDRVDALLFTGEMPYTIVSNRLQLRKPSFIVPFNTACVYKVLWHIIESGISLDRISFDMIEPKEIYETLLEVGLNKPEVYTSQYEPGKEVDPMVMADWHYNLWKEGKINAAITCLYSAYRVLKEKGVPAFRAIYPKATIRQTLEDIIHEITKNRLKIMQIAVVLVNIDNFNKVVKKSGSEYFIQKTKLELYNILLDFAQSIQGAVFSFAGDDYIIFSTRGSILNGTMDYKNMSFVDEVRDKLDVTISCGIGFGKTVYDSEKSARTGISHAKAAGGNCIYIVEDDGSLTGPLGQENMLRYSLHYSEETLDTARAAGISAAYVQKLKAIREALGEDTVSASKLASYLKVTDRSARRIISNLVKTGFAQVASEENPGRKGRPRKIYSINL